MAIDSGQQDVHVAENRLFLLAAYKFVQDLALTSRAARIDYH